LYFNANIMCSFTKSFSFWGAMLRLPDPPTGAPPLDPTGGLPAPRPPVFFCPPIILWDGRACLWHQHAIYRCQWEHSDQRECWSSLRLRYLGLCTRSRLLPEVNTGWSQPTSWPGLWLVIVISTVLKAWFLFMLDTRLRPIQLPVAH